MLHTDVHPELPAITARAVLLEGVEDAERAAMEAGASAGCTRCARALVNAIDTGAALAIAPPPAIVPSGLLRARVLREAARRSSPRLASIFAPARVPPDPSAGVARHHLTGPAEAARIAEVDALSALDPIEGEATPRLLAELERLIRFPILFVSIVRGDRVGYRVQRGLDPELAEFRQIRREMSY
ncbi:MAG: hypothetical protein ABI193_27060, partial [Minicystis sp.]